MLCTNLSRQTNVYELREPIRGKQYILNIKPLYIDISKTNNIKTYKKVTLVYLS